MLFSATPQFLVERVSSTHGWRHSRGISCCVPTAQNLTVRSATSAREVIVEQTTRRTSGDRSTSSTHGWRVLDPHAPDAGLLARLQSLDTAVTLKVRPPFRLPEAIALQAEVKALIARRPAPIVLDMDGLLPLDEMGVLMLSTLARDAAGEGAAVVLANPSRPLHDRLVQLGIHDLTLVDRRVPTPTEDEGEQGADGHGEVLPSSPCPFCGTLRQGRTPVPDGAPDPASVVAARQLVDDARRARTQPPGRPIRRDRPSPAADGAAGRTQDLEPSADQLRRARTAGTPGSRQGPAGRRSSPDAADGHADNPGRRLDDRMS